MITSKSSLVYLWGAALIDPRSAETIQGGKKPGMTVAAYKLLVALKLEQRVV
jgi:hypothetical protein